MSERKPYTAPAVRDEPRCQQQTCLLPATCTYAWPGYGTVLACKDCAARAKTVARVMGFPLDVIELGANASLFAHALEQLRQHR